MAFDSYLSFCELLLLYGDVELNPGPMTKAEAEQLEQIAQVLTQLKADQATILTKLTAIETNQIELEKKIDSVIAKSTAIENRIMLVEESERKLEARLDDLENRSRRLNLFVFLESATTSRRKHGKDPKN